MGTDGWLAAVARPAILLSTLRGKAVTGVEIYTPSGVFVGEALRIPLTGDGSDLTEPLALADARWYPIDGSRPTQRGAVTVPVDDILVITTPAPELKVHMAWYSIAIDVGPYHVAGRLATHPGFDPARAIARPGGAFIALSDATVELAGRIDSGVAERPYLHVNRFAVDRVTSSLMLGHFFPGARLMSQESATPVR